MKRKKNPFFLPRRELILYTAPVVTIIYIKRAFLIVTDNMIFV